MRKPKNHQGLSEATDFTSTHSSRSLIASGIEPRTFRIVALSHEQKIDHYKKQECKYVEFTMRINKKKHAIVKHYKNKMCFSVSKIIVLLNINECLYQFRACHIPALESELTGCQIIDLLSHHPTGTLPPASLFPFSVYCVDPFQRSLVSSVAFRCFCYLFVANCL